MNLSIVEKFLLLAHHPTKGGFIISEIHINFGIIGSILLEMSFENYFRIENDRLMIKNERTPSNPLYSEIFIRIRDSKKARKLKYWVTRLNSKSNKYKWMILKDLQKKGLIDIEDKKFLWLIPYKKSRLTDSLAHDRFIQELKNNISNRHDISNENTVVLALVDACKMHKVFAKSRAEVKVLKKDLKSVIEESAVGDTVDETIKEVQRAITNTIAASTVVITAS